MRERCAQESCTIRRGVDEGQTPPLMLITTAPSWLLVGRGRARRSSTAPPPPARGAALLPSSGRRSAARSTPPPRRPGASRCTPCSRSEARRTPRSSWRERTGRSARGSPPASRRPPSPRTGRTGRRTRTSSWPRREARWCAPRARACACARAEGRASLPVNRTSVARVGPPRQTWQLFNPSLNLKALFF